MNALNQATGKVMRPKVGVGAVSSPMEVGANLASGAAEELAVRLSQAGCEVIRLGAIQNADAAAAAGRKAVAEGCMALALAAVSWYEDYLAVDLLEECPVPLLLWALPGMETGALCGNQQANWLLRQIDAPVTSVYGSLQDSAALGSARSFLLAAALRHRLLRARIGLAGSRVAGMTECAVNEPALKKAFGSRLVQVDMASLLKTEREGDPGEKAKLWKCVKTGVAKVEVGEEVGLQAAGMVLAIRKMIQREGLSALAFGCYPDYMGCACLAASVLAEEGIPIACEGDGNGAVGMLLMMGATSGPVHNTDWLEPLPDGSVVFSHCGSGSYALAAKRDAIVLAPVRLANRGVCSLFTAKPGPVTLLNIVPDQDGYQMAVMEGEALEVTMVFPGNPLRVNLGGVERPLRWIQEQGMGHHWMVGYGHVGGVLRDFARMAGPSLRYLEMRA